MNVRLYMKTIQGCIDFKKKIRAIPVLGLHSLKIHYRRNGALEGNNNAGKNISLRRRTPDLKNKMGRKSQNTFRATRCMEI